MDEKVDPSLFTRLMRLSPTTRKDLLEYLGQGPVSSRAMLDPLMRKDATPPPQTIPEK
jgi:hypothetical protein